MNYNNISIYFIFISIPPINCDTYDLAQKAIS